MMLIQIAEGYQICLTDFAKKCFLFMNRLYVSFQINLLGEGRVTFDTLVRNFLMYRLYVSLQICFLIERRLTFVTLVSDLFVYRVYMTIEITFLFKSATTMNTLKTVTIDMFLQMRCLGKTFFTDLTLLNTVFGLFVSQ